jgi:hypothetical protein
MDKMKSANSPKKRDIFRAARKLKEKIDLIELDNDDGTKEDVIHAADVKLIDYTKDFEIFHSKIEEKKATIKNCTAGDREVEAIKLIMDDWIYFTSNLLNSRAVNEDDWQLFKGYLLYLVNEKKNSDFVVVVLKLFKRLVIKNGSKQWIKVYGKICKEVQTDFYQKYNALLKIDD